MASGSGSIGAQLARKQSFERSPRDVLALQSEVARAIARKGDVALTPQEQARLADAPEARALLVELEEMMKQRYFCPYEIGTVYVSLGDKDTAYKWFRKGTAERADCMAWLGVERGWIRSAPIPAMRPSCATSA